MILRNWFDSFIIIIISDFIS